MVALAAVLRIVHAVQLAGTPVVELHRWTESDMSFFHAWGRRLAAGDWLGREPFHPLHGWHRDIAREHLATHRGVRAELAGEVARRGGDATVEGVLWERWYGGVRFHQAPLQPYLIGLTYRLAGASPWAVFTWQLLLGVAATLLVALVAARAFGDVAGLLAGLLFALSPVPLHFETVLLRVPLLVVLALAFTWLLGRALDVSSGRRWAAVGAVSGLAVLAKPTLVLLPAGAVLLLGLGAWRRHVPAGIAARAAAVTFSVAVAMLVPAVVRNVAVGAPALSLSSVGAVTFIRANAADVPADEPALVTRHAARLMDESDGRLGAAVAPTLRTWDGVGPFLLSRLARLREVVSWQERPNNTNFAFHARYSDVLAALPVTAPVAWSLGLVGLALAVGRPRTGPLLVTVTALLVPLLAFHVHARYRCPLQVVALPFAAWAVVRVSRWLRAGPRRSGFLAGAAVLALAALLAPPADAPPRIRAADLALAHSLAVGPAVEDARAAGDFQGSAALWQDLASRATDEERSLAARGQVRHEEERRLAGVLALLHEGAAEDLARAGRDDDARAHRERAVALRRLSR